MQSRGGDGFILKALQLPGIQGGGKGQHLQSDATAQRNLLGLVDDAHAAAANFADQAEISESAQLGEIIVARWRVHISGPPRAALFTDSLLQELEAGQTAFER